jgi:hypothetical protein
MMRPVFSTAMDVYLGSDEQEWNEELMLYPNPATNQVQIQLPNESAITVVITDLSGREVYRQAHQSAHVSVDVSTFNPGNYLVQVHGAGAFITKKLVVN